MASKSSVVSRDKIRGLLVGTAIGDALGIPVETFTAERIREKYPQGLTKYEVPDGHKWYEGQPAGVWSDDTALTIATMRGLIIAKDFTLESQAVAAIMAMNAAELTATHQNTKVGGSGVPGWGSSTVESIRRLANNVHWKESGKTTTPNRGTGNGAVMRCAPLAAYFVVAGSRKKPETFNQKVCDFSAMTHYTDVSAIATVCHVQMLIKMLESTPEQVKWHQVACGAVRDCQRDTSFAVSGWDGTQYWSYEHLNLVPDNTMWYDLHVATGKVPEEHWDDAKIEQEFGGGSCYVGHSVPFTYAHMAREPLSIQTLYRVAGAGGDTDTNASLVGGVLGALHGMSVFPDHLVNDLIGSSELFTLADEFCDTFNVK